MVGSFVFSVTEAHHGMVKKEISTALLFYLVVLFNIKVFVKFALHSETIIFVLLCPKLRQVKRINKKQAQDDINKKKCNFWNK